MHWKLRQGVDLVKHTRRKIQQITSLTILLNSGNFSSNLFPILSFSFFKDGSTDCGNVENELVVIVYCSKDSTVEKVFLCPLLHCRNTGF